MSYRSLKAILGETNLERKCLFLFGVCLFALIAGSFWWYGSRTEKQVYLAAQRTGRGMVDAIMLRMHWERLAAEREEELALNKSIGEDLRNQAYKRTALIKPQSDGPDQPKDEYDWRALDAFRAVPPSGDEQSPQFMAYSSPRDKEYIYYQPVRAKAGSCIVCHNIKRIAAGLPEWQEGDLMAVVKVVFSDEENRKALAENLAILITTAIITVFMAMFVSYLIIRYVIVKPLRHLRDVSNEISRGNTSMRAEIHTGDEFEALAAAFNRMLRHLTDIQTELRTVNNSLDMKVDELAQSNMRLYEMNRVKSDFLATMSHELRTPLNAIIGFSDVLGAIDSLDDKQKRYVKNIQGSGRVLLEMINDILDLAKIDAGKMEVRLSEFRIESIISAQCDMSRPLSERKNIDLEAITAPDLPPLRQDLTKVQQILNNLLSNAIKFTPEGGRIVVTARRSARVDALELVVADTGVGIAEDEQQIIFEKFRQGKSVLARGDAMTREYSGTGLGLSIVKELCRLLGGEIALDSELGKGSTFRVTLPWRKDEAPRAEPFVETEHAASADLSNSLPATASSG